MGEKRVCGVAPCGAGKTIMTGWMIKEAVARGKTAVFFVHRKELIDQTADTFRALNIPFGIISSDAETNYNLPVQIAGVQTLVNRLDELKTPDLLICDECHHILAKTYMKIIEHWKSAYLLGVTATPERLGGIRLGKVFQSLVLAPSVKDLIGMGHLTDFVYYAPNFGLDFSKLTVRRGDYVIDEAACMMSDGKVIYNIVDNYKKRANGKSAICYCVNIEHSKIVAENFNKAGISAAQVDGTTPKAERQRIVDEFRAGNITILCNAELFGEGFDLPCMDAVILARPTKSLTLHIQQSMRPMRPDYNNPKKVAIILDCVDRHLGLPDEPRHWSLASNKKKTPKPAPTKVCPHCEAVIYLSARYCPHCGYEFDFEKDLSEYDGELSRVLRGLEKFLQIAKAKGYKKGWAVFRVIELATSYEDLLEIAEVMGYAKGWAWHKWNEKKDKLEKNPRRKKL